MNLDAILRGDCVDLLPRVGDRSVDLIVCDPPYGTTSNRWDVWRDLVAFVRQIGSSGMPRMEAKLTLGNVLTLVTLIATGITMVVRLDAALGAQREMMAEVRQAVGRLEEAVREHDRKLAVMEDRAVRGRPGFDGSR